MNGTKDQLTARYSWASHNWVLLCIAIFAVGLAVAAYFEAPLTWDGAYYLFSMLDSGEPFVAHHRIADRWIHWPVVWSLNLFDPLIIPRLVFSVIHVAAPVVALIGSWLVVRNHKPHLIIWPLIAIGMSTLPGQINFISEGIKSSQLMWPLLLAVLVGLPKTLLPWSLLLGAFLFYLHPAVVPIFIACGLSALAMSRVHGANRNTLLASAFVMFVVAGLRFRQIADGYESSEMTWHTQQRQWENSAFGAPMWVLGGAGAIAIILLALPSMSTRVQHILRWILPAIAVVGFVPLYGWASESANWWNALEFRGPALATSMVAALGAFLATMLPYFRRETSIATGFLGPLGMVVAVGFSSVLIVQSSAWNDDVDKLNSTLSKSEQQCVPREMLPGMPESPLNLWSTNALSLLFGDLSPTKISMTAEQCRVNLATNDVFIAPNWTPHEATHFDFTMLERDMATSTTCYWSETSGWYEREYLEPDRWRWTEREGVIIVTVPRNGNIVLEGDLVTARVPNTIEIEVNGMKVRTVQIEGEPYQMITGMELPVVAGNNQIVIRSQGIASVPEGDTRPLAVSVWNLEIRWSEDSAPCLNTGGQ